MMKNAKGLLTSDTTTSTTINQTVHSYKSIMHTVEDVTDALGNSMLENETETVGTPDLMVHIEKLRHLAGTPRDIGNASVSLAQGINQAGDCQTLSVSTDWRYEDEYLVVRPC